MRILAVDIGTNSVRYLICDVDSDGELSVIERGGEITRLGQDLHANGLLDHNAVERTARTAAEIVTRGKGLHVEKTLLAATSAARDAANSEYFVDRLRLSTGIELQILSGIQEAEAIYAGVTHEMPELQEKALIIDIGGGSTECIYHLDTGEVAFNSIDIGAVRMTERFVENDPPRKDELSEMHSFVINQFEERISAKDFSSLKCIGVGGTITTLPAIILGMTEYDRGKVHGYALKKREIRDVLEELSSITLTERKRITGLQVRRADIIVAGIVILESFLDFAGFDGLQVSDRGILFGLALKAAGTGTTRR